MDAVLVERAKNVLARLENSFKEVLPKDDFVKVGNFMIRVRDLSTSLIDEHAAYYRVEIHSRKQSYILLSLATDNTIGVEAHNLATLNERLEQFVSDLETLADKAKILD